MKCQKCNTENPSTNKFCENCGTTLFIACFKCKTNNSVEVNFCGNCGTSMRESEAVTDKLVPSTPKQSNSLKPEHSKFKRWYAIVSFFIIIPFGIWWYLFPSDWGRDQVELAIAPSLGLHDCDCDCIIAGATQQNLVQPLLVEKSFNPVIRAEGGFEKIIDVEDVTDMFEPDKFIWEWLNSGSNIGLSLIHI